jgi:hypothetical protein
MAVLNPVHNTGELLDTTEAKNDAAVWLGALAELFRHVPDVLLDQVSKVLVFCQTRFHDAPPG